MSKVNRGGVHVGCIARKQQCTIPAAAKTVHSRFAECTLRVVLLLLALSLPAHAEERQLDGMSVIGNQDLPKALFIVPWKNPELGGDLPPVRNGLLDEQPSPVDPEVFRRELDNYEALNTPR